MHSWRIQGSGQNLSGMRIAGIAIASLLGAAASAAAGEAARVPGAPLLPAASATSASVDAPVRARSDGRRPPRGRTCFSQAETREKIAQRSLTDPVSAMRAGREEGEALRTRLCRWRPDELVYEVFVLRRDGHVVRLYMNAQNGQALKATEFADPK